MGFLVTDWTQRYEIGQIIMAVVHIYVVYMRFSLVAAEFILTVVTCSVKHLVPYVLG